jgi:hypothetical protein
LIELTKSNALVRNLRILLLILLPISVSEVQAQGIVNTEKMLSNADEELSAALDISGNFSFGNIRLFQSASGLSAGIKKGKKLYRGVFGYDYLRSEGSVKSSDLFHQFRFNHFISNHSLYGFYQVQNTKSLRLKNRWLTGAGIRFSLHKKAENYFDVAIGGFYESELYNATSNNGSELSIDNVKGNINSFWKLQLAENVDFTNTFYYQVAVDSITDQRLFIESKISYSLKKADFTITYRNRSHTEPYIEGIDKSDQRLLFGFSFDL